MAYRKTRLAAATTDGLLAELSFRALLAPQPYMARVRATARGVFLSVPVCHQRDLLGLVVAKVLSQPE